MLDNFDLFDIEDRKNAEWEARLPVCDGCGEHMSEWYEVSYKLQTWRFCKECCQERYYEE